MSERFKPFATVALIIEHEGRFLMVEEKNEFGATVFGMLHYVKAMKKPDVKLNLRRLPVFTIT